MVSYYDHATGTFPEPVCVFDKWCADAHDNPALQIDPQGFLWLFSPSHGDWTTRSFIHRSGRPYDITEWETICDGPLFAYPQPWVSAEHGWCLVHVVYDGAKRGIHIKHSPDGRTWVPPRPLANMAQGHYVVSWADPATGRIGLAFDYHPSVGGLEARTNLYYVESPDWGHTWRTITGGAVELPLLDPELPARVLEFENAGDLNCLRKVKFDAAGLPIVVFVCDEPRLAARPGERPAPVEYLPLGRIGVDSHPGYGL